MSGRDPVRDPGGVPNRIPYPLTGSRTGRGNLKISRLPGAPLPGAQLPDARLPGARRSGARLPGARLPGARLPGARLLVILTYLINDI